MFQYATALSVEGNVGAWPEYPGAVDKFLKYVELFPDVKIVPQLPEGITHFHQPDFSYCKIPRESGKDLMIWGYFQSERFFRDPSLVRARFRMSDQRRKYLQGKYGDWLTRPGVTGISVRRGDYMQKPQHHPFVGKAYFKECLSRLSDVQDFIVCSDEIGWCRAFFQETFPRRNFLFVEGESVLDQLYVHTLCANNIISNSSFSWWGAWLNDCPTKRVLAPSLWFGFDLYRSQEAWKDIYFKGAEIVPTRYSCGEYMLAWSKVIYWDVRRFAGRCKRRWLG